MTYEIFQQKGYSTDILHDGQKGDTITLDYTGASLRDRPAKHKRMLCNSGSHPYIINHLKEDMLLFDNDEDIHISNVKQLPLLKTPIIDSSLQALFQETQNAVKGHDITIRLTHTKTQSAIGKTSKTQLEKSEEFVALILEGNDNPNESRCVVGIRPTASDYSLAEIQSIKDWIVQRRKLTRPLPAGKYPLVFAPGVGGILIHEVVGHQFELSRPYSAYSPANFKKGHQLFSKNLTVVDAPFSLMPAHTFDDEGITKKKAILIKKGAVNSPLTDRYSKYAYPGYTFTGNARRGSYIHFPEPRMYNTYVENGTDSISQAISGIEYGFYVQQISYASCHFTGGVKACVGRASIIKRGKITGTPATFMIEDNVSSFLNVKHVCNDMLTIPGYCYSVSGGLYVEHGSPTIGFDAVNIRNITHC